MIYTAQLALQGQTCVCMCEKEKVRKRCLANAATQITCPYLNEVKAHCSCLLLVITCVGNHLTACNWHARKIQDYGMHAACKAPHIPCNTEHRSAQCRDCASARGSRTQSMGGADGALIPMHYVRRCRDATYVDGMLVDKDAVPSS